MCVSIIAPLSVRVLCNYILSPFDYNSLSLSPYTFCVPPFSPHTLTRIPIINWQPVYRTSSNSSNSASASINGTFPSSAVASGLLSSSPPSDHQQYASLSAAPAAARAGSGCGAASSSSSTSRCRSTPRSPPVDSFAAAATAGATTTTDEYPNSVQELVMNGFDLSKVLRAYDLVGDNFDDLLSFLLSASLNEGGGKKAG